jgi:hypothetical protein
MGRMPTRRSPSPSGTYHVNLWRSYRASLGNLHLLATSSSAIILEDDVLFVI